MSTAKRSMFAVIATVVLAVANAIPLMAFAEEPLGSVLAPATYDADGMLQSTAGELNLIQSGKYIPDQAFRVKQDVVRFLSAQADGDDSSSVSAITDAQRAGIRDKVALSLQEWDGKTFYDESEKTLPLIDVSELDIPVSDANMDAITAVVSDYINRNPKYFFIGGTVWSYYFPDAKSYSSIALVASYEVDQISVMQEKFDKALAEALSWIGDAENASDVDKAKSIHDYLVRNCNYNNDAADKGAPEEYGSSNPWNAYGALVEGRPVCQGYSLAFIACMKEFGIECDYVSQMLARRDVTYTDGSLVYEGHGWNRVEIDGCWYNLDITWDDNQTDPEKTAMPEVTYFLKSDDWFKENAPEDIEKKFDNDGKLYHTAWVPEGVAGTNGQYDEATIEYWRVFGEPEIESLSFGDSIVMYVGDKEILPVEYEPSTLAEFHVAREAVWKSSNESALIFDERGYAKALAPGESEVTCTIDGCEASIHVVVRAGRFSSDTVELTGLDGIEYTGELQQPALEVKCNGKLLESPQDYIVEWPDEKVTTAGTKTLRLVGKGDYAGETIDVSYTVSQRDIANASISPIGNQTFSGKAINPSPMLKDGSFALKSGVDYSISYSDNVEIGTAMITISGKGNYRGSATVSFTINPIAKLAYPTVYSGFVYDGSNHVAARTAVGYSFSGTASAVNAGTYTVVAALKPGYLWTDGTDYNLRYTWSVKRANIAEASVAGIANKTYNGRAQEQAPVVRVDGRTLRSGVDYAIGYSNNVNTGTASLTITGKGNYAGSVSKTFTIAKAANPITVKAVARSAKASKLKKKAVTLARPLTVKRAQGKLAYKKISGNKKITVNAKTGKLTLEKGLKKGKYNVKIRITAKGNANYNAASKKIKVVVRVK